MSRDLIGTKCCVCKEPTTQLAVVKKYGREWTVTIPKPESISLTFRRAKSYNYTVYFCESCAPVKTDQFIEGIDAECAAKIQSAARGKRKK